MKIFSQSDKLILELISDNTADGSSNTVLSDNSFRSKSIMGDNILSLEFQYPGYIDIPVGSWCEFKNEKYTLLQDSNFTKNNTRQFNYSLLLDSEQGKTKDVKYKFATVTRNQGQLPRFDYTPKIEFPLTAKPIDFIQLFVDNMNIANNESGWKVGECIDAPIKTLDFNDQYCFDVLGQLAQQFDTEWEIENKIVNFCKIEKMKESALSLSYGKGKGFVSGVGRSNAREGKQINRLFIKGSDRNIAFATYGESNLHMPKNTSIKYDGRFFSDEEGFADTENAIEYITDMLGSYVEQKSQKGRIIEGSLDCTDIYPMREGEVEEVGTDIYSFYDKKAPDYESYIIPGNTMTLIFQSGDLTGKEFDVKFDYSKKEFKINKIEEKNDITYPSEHLIPRKNNKYGVFHIDLPQEYIDTAELKILKKAVKFLFDNEKPQYTYSGVLDKIYAKTHWGEIGGRLNCGYYVDFSDPQFMEGASNIRIIEIKEYITQPIQPELTLSNKVSGKSFSTQLNKIENQEQTIDRNKEEAIQYTKRRFRDSQETLEMLRESLLNFGESINPITVQTMAMLVGDQSLQFRFVDNKENPSQIPYNISYSEEMGTLHCPKSILQHMTLGITSISSDHKYKFWDMKEYISDVITEKDKKYYLYARCEETGTEGDFLLSEEAIKMDNDDNQYHFLVGILNSEFEGERSFVTLYGFTEILPGRITTDKIVSGDGESYIDLVNNTFKLGKDDSSIDYNITKENTLTISNATIRNALNVDGVASIAGFLFSNQNIRSENMVDNKSSMELNGKEGYMTFNSKIKKMMPINGEIDITQSITLDSKEGHILISDQYHNRTLLTPQGIYSETEGLELYPLSGIDLKASIVGHIRKPTDNKVWDAVIGVFGGDSMDTSDNSLPSYGGWFRPLKAEGYYQRVSLVYKNATLNKYSSYVSCENSQESISIQLPPNPYEGQTIYIRKTGGKHVNINGNGKKIHTDSYHDSHPAFGSEGDMTILVYNGVAWCLNGMYR